MAASVSNVVSTSYVSVACNRTPNALDWAENGLVAFAASHSVVLYDPKVFLCTLIGKFINVILLLISEVCWWSREYQANAM